MLSMIVFQTSSTSNDGYDNIFNKFDFQDPGIKVKVNIAIFRRKSVIA